MAPMRVQDQGLKLPVISPPPAIPQCRKQWNLDPTFFLKTTPFILEKRQILLQGSLSA
jgi:hypothetical protein